MNIQQMHIEVDLSLQKISSNVKRKFHPDEIDWLLNKNIGRFVENTIDPNPEQKEKGFQADAIDLSAIQTLLVYDHQIPVYKLNTTHEYVLAQLPGNYEHYLEVSAGTVRDCDSTYPQVRNFITKSEYVYTLKVPKTTKVGSPYYQNVSLVVNGSTILSANKFHNSLPGQEMNFVIQDILKNELLHTPYAFKIYYERYNGMYSSETFFFVSDTSLTTVTLNMDSIGIPATLLTLSGFAPVSNLSYNTGLARIIRGTAVGVLLKSAFARTKWDSPVTVVHNNSVQVYHDNKFIVNNLSLDYIRKPRLVNLSLGYSCDLPELVHQKICDMTVEYIKQAIGDPNYQWKLQDNQIRG